MCRSAQGQSDPLPILLEIVRCAGSAARRRCCYHAPVPHFSPGGRDMSATALDISTNGDWRLMPCKHDDGPASRAAIGLLTLNNDVTIEPELRNFLPIDGVAVYATRIPMSNAGGVEALRALEGHITEAAALIVPEFKIDVMALGCTSGSMAIGPEVVAQRIRAARPGMACTNPVSAAAKALHAFGCKRIALLDPYSDEVKRGGGALRERAGLRHREQGQLQAARRSEHRAGAARSSPSMPGSRLRLRRRWTRCSSRVRRCGSRP